MHMQVHELQDYVKKVPQITALFWLTKFLRPPLLKPVVMHCPCP